MATLAAAVTVTAPDRTTVIERSELTRWTEAAKAPERGARRADPLGVVRGRGAGAGDRRHGKAGARATARGGRRDTARPDPSGPRRLTCAPSWPRRRSGSGSGRRRRRASRPQQIDAYVQAHPRTEPGAEDAAGRGQATSERNARRAKAALKRGATWRTVARRYSIDDASAGCERSGDAGHASGPGRASRLRGEAGAVWPRGSAHYVVKVVAIEPEHPTPLKTQQAAAWEILASEAQLNALTAYEQALVDKWRPRTICASDLAAHRDCGNTGTVSGPESG